ncbi:SRPBCC family protein [Brachybacterium sp. JHP9]|uniref:SRPBCC family protein n=1 Tax=Brachybacterium equifaecis TaxID=2910770 RepID=A0ABT0R3J3_9MICO|nr:SRPBCC family protein [Brachybacterium equifaecis]MCL6424038.1 SRPBCC family protein [Brachybacterium equifaecis]
MSTFSISRSAHTSAAPEQVVPLLHDFHEWERWSPWEGLDENMRRTYEGPARGMGAKYTWEGDKKAGAGTMRMIRADERGAGIALSFTKPFKATNQVTIDVAPAAGGGSDLTWTMTGEQGLFGRLFYKVFPMEKMLAKDFDKGLAQLAVEAEKDAAKG